MRIVEVNSERPYIKLLVYATFGVGKTRLAGTAAEHPEMGDVLLARCEDGHATITHQNCMMTPKIRTFKEMENLFWALAHKKKQVFTTVDEEGQKTTQTYDFGAVKTLIIDSVTALLQTCTEGVVDDKLKKDPNKEPFPTIRDFGAANFMMKRLMRQFFELDIHIIATALVREQYNTDDPTDKIKRGPITRMPDLTPKLAGSVMAFADYVWWMEAKKSGQRVLHTQPSGPWYAKTRGDIFAKKLPDAIGDPDLPTIYNLLKEVQKETR